MSKLKLEVGKHYLNAKGEIVKIVENMIHPDLKIDTAGTEYESNGKVFDGNYKFDLIAEVPDSLLFNICSSIVTYHTQPSYRYRVDEAFKKFDIKKDK